MAMSYAIGVLGMCFIVAGWALSLREVPPLRLSLLYGIGSALLAAYACCLGDPVFLALNCAAAALSLANAARALRSRSPGGARLGDA